MPWALPTPPRRLLVERDTLQRPDRFADDVHGGSPDLSVWPASVVELHFASRALADPGDLASWRWLLACARSTARADALVAEVRRIRDADRVLTRVAL